MFRKIQKVIALQCLIQRKLPLFSEVPTEKESIVVRDKGGIMSNKSLRLIVLFTNYIQAGNFVDAEQLFRIASIEELDIMKAVLIMNLSQPSLKEEAKKQMENIISPKEAA